VVDDESYAAVLADLRERLQQWMVQTDDPLLRGPVPPPVGSRINAQTQASADEPTRLITEADSPVAL
jgi:hypothetical protein